MSWKDRSFEVLPALRVRGKPLRHTLRTVTAAWMFGIIWMSGVSGSQMTDFCWLLGFDDFHFGLLQAIPCAATVAQLVAAVYVERSGLRKYLFLYTGTIHRLLWLVIAVIPLIVRPGRAAIAAFLMTYAVSSILGHVASPPWQTWMGDLIPRRIRGRYFSFRRIYTIPLQVVVTIVSGYLMDRSVLPMAPGVVMTPANQPYLTMVICGIFIFSGLCGAMDILLFRKVREMVSPPLLEHPEPSQEPAGRRLLHAFTEPALTLLKPLADRQFRNYALYAASITFAANFGGSYYMTNALKNIGYSKLGANVVLIVFGALSGMFMARGWGRLIDTWGRRPVLILGTIGVVFGILGWMFIPPGNMVLAYVLGIAACVWGGVMWGAINLAQVSLVMGFSDTAGRSKFVAASAVFSNVGGFFGGLLGGVLAQKLVFLQAHPLHVGPFLWNNYHITFIVSSVARAASLVWLIGLVDPGSRPFGDLVRAMWLGLLEGLGRLVASRRQ